MQEHQEGRRPAIFERDIDKLLERNLVYDPDFAVRLVEEVSKQSKIPLCYQNLTVKRQARHEGATGSIDVLVQLFTETSAETGRILIENKLDSSFTPTQPERYATSAITMSRAGRPAVPIICAPAEYIRKSKYLGPFRAKIAYEDVTRWLHGDDLALIRQAILRFSMPYEPDPVPAVADFHEGYGRLAQQLAPELVVKRNPNATGARPEGSTTIYFVTKKCLPRWDFLPTLRFSHQCLDSNAPSPSVKVMFDRWAIHETLLRQLSGTALGNTPLYLRRAGGSLGLVHDTPGMDQMRPVGDQIDAVSAGIRAAAALRAWMFANESTLREWAAAVDETRA